ncbi:hypothetical protein Aglo01_46670 [Actinokineospora globicatena]|nr:hypothetical protein Aglo01_46670 [Actinokineospora globicatena]GLW87015.1 hypothetical protein Aglo02_46540 [Actinokineospora globicatena]
MVLTADERETPQRWARRATSAQTLTSRCRAVPACAEGLSTVEAAARLDGWKAPAPGRRRGAVATGRRWLGLLLQAELVDRVADVAVG